MNEIPIFKNIFKKIASKKGEIPLIGAIVGVASFFVLLYVLAVVFGNLQPTLANAANHTGLSAAVTSLNKGTVMFFSMAAMVGVIGAAVIIIRLFYNPE